MTPERFARLLASAEGARVEFKAAERHFGFDELVRYCVALANEGGGTIVLGVTDERPRRIVGTAAFPEPGRTEAMIYERLGQRVSAEEYYQDGKRMLLFHVPSGMPGPHGMIEAPTGCARAMRSCR